MEFWQGDRPDTLAFSPDPAGRKDIVTIAMRPEPFELRFPKPPKGVAVQICAWSDKSIFSITQDGKVDDSVYFRPGTGMADFEFGSGGLQLSNEGHNYLDGERISEQSPTADKVDFVQVGVGGGFTPLKGYRGDIFLTVFIDKKRTAVSA
jgi:hypothetical protein